MRLSRLTWPIASHLVALLATAMLLTFTLVGAGTVAYRLPAIERQDRDLVRGQVEDVSRRLEALLGTAESHVSLVQARLDDAPADQAQRLLSEEMRAAPALGALYRVSPEGIVVAASVRGAHVDDLVGIDLSRNPLVRALAQRPGAVWNGRYLSPATGMRTVGVGLRDRHGNTLIAEMDFDAYFRYVLAAADEGIGSFWIVERSGEIVVDSQAGRLRGRLNLRDWPLLQDLAREQVAVREVQVLGRPVLAAATYSAALDWYFVMRTPMGLDHPEVRDLLASVAWSFVGCLLTGLVVATFWARRLARPLEDIVARARAAAGGATAQAWPRGPVTEFNALAHALETMSAALHEREQRFLAIFNAAPMPMSVVDAGNGLHLLDVNEAWCRDLRRRREDVLGRTAVEFGLWSRAERERLLTSRDGDKLRGEARLLRGDGEPMQVQVYGQHVHLPTQELLLWATVDIGPLRARELALRELNQELEERVAQRTEALAESNAALAGNVERLRAAQEVLVRSATMAALGGLVAGVAHELNTPLGNGVMAVSALASVLQRFQAAMQRGLRRADLDEFLDGLQQGTEIAQRNLQRAAELVQSFKRVAVDQTSAKRRRFELYEVVHEMVASLRPSYARMPYRIEMQVPPHGLAMDSYPGALGQVLAQLVDNAIVHGFDGRGHGTVRIDAWREADGGIVLRVADDGQGIPAADLDRVFEPFMTTRMGRGGPGLGLHTSYNAVATLLGGTLSLDSREGEGTCCTVRLPAEAPRTPLDPQARERVLLNSLW